MALMLDAAKLGRFVDQIWSDAIVPTLVDYIRIPNKSPSFDPDWAAHGHMEEAVSLFERWARTEIAALSGATLEIVRLPGRTPLMLIEVPGEGAETVLLYGHLDKQPEMAGWAQGYGPCNPATPPGWCHRASGFGGSCCPASRTRPPARSVRRRSMRRSRPSGSSRQSGPPRRSATAPIANSPSPAAPGRWPTTRPSWC